MSKGNMNQMLKQASQMQNKLMTLQKELEARELDISAGGGMVKIKINGKQEILNFELNPECVDPSDVEMLQELVKTAVNQAIKESQDMVSTAMSKISGGINIPGLF
ncbi:MAG: nucleoid-associated protein, YbaB/EbfC family [Bdellovibrionales bacterium RIFOXYD12_FULL_39_22]|nr:MAG: nucleoid-associated protein, YbaB/EbfC family [Bdellovibrionales bacterium RIFOXYB1_FULL_39_21]OFZ41390.1 MAG: nucleoid-associated protein, YbaB/EbfC family [Bdellovibrionales bacterium RIFOXYC12_FULL_39_17]OFZ45345.1 MAG: nucleoid-associated protein, YbaB/EbfC family [Bdellovibrionales bacterium RIFOXYC1_FULL_39_130]OFZ68783.1 MAG: nucleoid-associated protein, YbaB/EbfC family [Bdellovibrionales bacterium RIFOXYC2_FULL_39_8]OFZ74541.1 MAG: nucleoid-associated protein, YbaB/EbfC family 